MNDKVVVVGCGYVGKRLMSRLPIDTGLAVARKPTDTRFRWLNVDLDSGVLEPLIKACDGAEVYYFVPPSATSERDDRSHRLLDAFFCSKYKPESVVLISTTGVYGDCAGEWVHEERALRPVAVRSLRRADAEQAWAGYADRTNLPLAILRVAGIYGPAKLPIARLKKSQPLLVESQSPCSNRVHVDDLLDTALAAAGCNTVVNVADGSPSTMTAYFHALADALGVERLPEASREQLEAEWSEGLASYMGESRRIDNSRMRALLGGTLRYPDLAAGLAACLKS